MSANLHSETAIEAFIKNFKDVQPLFSLGLMEVKTVILLAVGTYVCLKSYPYTHKGTIAGGSMLDGRMRYIFHLDERITAVECSDRYVYEWDLDRCERPDDEEVALINRLSMSA